MFSPRQMAIVLIGAGVLLIGHAGCELAVDLDSRTERTYWYIAQFQGLDFRSREELAQLRSALVNNQQANDVDAVSRSMAELGAKYSSIADQVKRLDTKDVDEDAVTYVNGFAALYQELGEFHQRGAKATSERDAFELQTMRPEFETMKRRIETMQGDRKTLFQTLSDRYGGKDFNIVDH